MNLSKSNNKEIMKTRIIYTKFWYDTYISDLNTKEKLLFIYLVTNEKVTICGIYELPDKYILLDVGITQKELDTIKEKFMVDNKFTFIDGWVRIENFEIYNKFTGNLNETAKEKELSLIPKKVIEYQRGIDRVSSVSDTLSNHKSIISNHKSETNNKKQRYMDSVLLTLEEYEKLIKSFGEDKTKDYIENLNNYIGSKGKKYKSHYFTILNWSKKDKKSKINIDDINLEG
tara:strand:- start:360 stop:1049 length:690 start_codon:yes stop_codon:yes gene_type:complete